MFMILNYFQLNSKNNLKTSSHSSIVAEFNWKQMSFILGYGISRNLKLKTFRAPKGNSSMVFSIHIIYEAVQRRVNSITFPRGNIFKKGQNR